MLVSQNVPYSSTRLFQSWSQMPYLILHSLLFIPQAVFTTLFTSLLTLYPILYLLSMPHFSLYFILHSSFSPVFHCMYSSPRDYSLLYTLSSMCSVASTMLSPLPSILVHPCGSQAPFCILCTVSLMLHVSCSPPTFHLGCYTYMPLYTLNIYASCTTSHIFSPLSKRYTSFRVISSLQFSLS